MRGAVPLHPYQHAWLADRSRFKIGMWSRQVGKTFCSTLEIVDDVMTARSEGRMSSWLMLSRADRQAREAMRAGIQRHAKAYGLALEYGEYDYVADNENIYRAHEWDAGGGCVVTALPANPDTARGFSRNVYLDEFGIHRDSRGIWAALFPSITRGWRIVITSTPKGKSGKFYELMTGRDSRWSRHAVTIHDAVRDGYPADVQELREGLNDDELWRQEYECDWLDEASAWLAYDLIDRAEDPLAGDPALYDGGRTYIGNDLAIRKDLWVAWVLEMVGDVAWTREIRTIQGGSFKQRDDVLHELVERYRPSRIAMDQTGMGEKPVEDAKRRYGEYVVEGVIFSGPRKLDLASEMKERFEDRRIRIPAGDRTLRTDLHSVKREASITGAPRLLVDEGETDGHADRFWAGALACGAAAGQVERFGFHRIDNHRDTSLSPLAIRGRRGNAPSMRWQRGGLA